ncbi:hypothetical protein AGLY_011157 [Aphis glycines]|uniref:Uncharacterized protein n=1 Tax=Aphis glycines TaxID=307491 RepID=A0A6G0TDJ9_APHGL|nr:hypothetical protein AGLY_011157 [Aphis glycines]
MCDDNQPIDEDSEVIKAISDHREGMVTHMIKTKGFHKASIQLNMSPLSVTDIFKPTIDDDDDTTDKEPPHHIRRLHKRPRMPAYVKSNEKTQYNTKTETNDDSKVEKSQILNELPKIDNSETMTTRRDHESLFANDEDESQNFEGHIPSSNLVSQHPKVRRKSMRKRSEHPISAAIVQQ